MVDKHFYTDLLNESVSDKPRQVKIVFLLETLNFSANLNSPMKTAKTTILMKSSALEKISQVFQNSE